MSNTGRNRTRPLAQLNKEGDELIKILERWARWAAGLPLQILFIAFFGMLGFFGGLCLPNPEIPIGLWYAMSTILGVMLGRLVFSGVGGLRIARGISRQEELDRYESDRRDAAIREIEKIRRNRALPEPIKEIMIDDILLKLGAPKERIVTGVVVDDHRRNQSRSDRALPEKAEANTSAEESR